MEKDNFIFGNFEPLTKKKRNNTKKFSNRDVIKKREKEEEEEGKKEEEKKKIKTLHDYAIEKEKLLEIPTEKHEQLPSMKDVLSYVSRLPVRPFWFKSSQENIINSNALKRVRTMDVLTRGYIKPFLKSGPYPCKNIRCECERLHGFRLRILQMPGKNDGVWCFLCHLYETNKLYFESLNRFDFEQEFKKILKSLNLSHLPATLETARSIMDKLPKGFVGKWEKELSCNYQIHYFMVQVDVPGEYRLDRTLDNEKDVRGLYGPFPIYNVNNYKKLNHNEIIESDAMVFRLTQTMSSNPIESCCTTKKDKGNSYSQIVGNSQKLYLESQQ
jgi:hypothetical protein